MLNFFKYKLDYDGDNGMEVCQGLVCAESYGAAAQAIQDHFGFTYIDNVCISLVIEKPIIELREPISDNNIVYP